MELDTNKRQNRVLFDFESIVDPKLSYIKYLKITNKEFNNKYPAEMEKFEFIRLYEHEPILEGLNLKEEDIVLDFPHFTGMKYLYKQYGILSGGLIKASIFCKNEQESQIIKKEIPQARILVGKRNNANINNFSRIVIGDYNTLLEFPIPKNIDIMMLDYASNYDEDGDIPIKPLVILYEKNTFTIAHAYPNIKIPEG